MVLAETLFKYVMTLPPAFEAAMNEEDFDRWVLLFCCKIKVHKILSVKGASLHFSSHFFSSLFFFSSFFAVFQWAMCTLVPRKLLQAYLFHAESCNFWT